MYKETKYEIRHIFHTHIFLSKIKEMYFLYEVLHFNNNVPAVLWNIAAFLVSRYQYNLGYHHKY